MYRGIGRTETTGFLETGSNPTLSSLVFGIKVLFGSRFIPPCGLIRGVSLGVRPPPSSSIRGSLFTVAIGVLFLLITFLDAMALGDGVTAMNLPP